MQTPTQTGAGSIKARHSFLFGRHIAHSLSPFLHQVIYDELGLAWRQERLDSDDMARFVGLVRDDAACFGASVTMPNKVAVLAHLDEMTGECRDVGACNTVYVREEPMKREPMKREPEEPEPKEAEEPKAQKERQLTRRILCGTNTDVVGIREALHRNVTPADMQRLVAGRPALVIGGGGAARSAVYALRRWLPVGAIYLVNRHEHEVDAVMAHCRAAGYGASLRHVATPDEARAPDTTPPGLVVSCVPDVEPRTEAEHRARLITEVLLTKGDVQGIVLDMCYHPTPHTRLVALASRQNWHVILGTEAAIWQGLEQDRYWTGLPVEDMPLRKVQDAMREKVSQGTRQSGIAGLGMERKEH